MRVTIATFIFTLVLSLALAGPVTKTTEKKSLVENTKLQKEIPKIEDIGGEKERSKKSTTTFCVEIRPGPDGAVQVPCACKDKGVAQNQVVYESASQISQVPQAAPEAPGASAASIVAPVAPASAPSPNVNIFHAIPHQPQTLNIIQPAPTFHAMHFSHPQPSSPGIQNVHIVQPSAQLPEPVPQKYVFTPASKPSMDIHTSEQSQHDKPSQPEAHPAPEKEDKEHSHKSEVHVSVLTEDNKKQQESKPYAEKIVEPAQKKPSEPTKIVQVGPSHQPSEGHFVVVPSSGYISVPQIAPEAFYQPPYYQLSSPIYQQGGSVLTQCSCKQTHPASPNLHSMIMPAEMRVDGRTSKIMPMTVLPYPVQGEKSAVTVHCNGEESSAPISSQSHDTPMIVNMQTVRSKDGMQGEENDMMQSNLKGERTISHLSMNTRPVHYYGQVSGLHAGLHKEPYGTPLYGNQHLYVHAGRNAEPTVTEVKQDKLKEMEVVPATSKSPELDRITRSDKETTKKLVEKEEKKTEEKTSSAKVA